VADRTRPRLKRHYSIVAHSANVVELRYGTWNAVSLTLTDEGGSGHLLSVLRRLDGTLSSAEIAAAEGAPKAEVESLLNHLGDLDLLEERSSHALDHYLDEIASTLMPYRDGRASSVRPSPVVFGDQRIGEEIVRLLAASGPSDGLDNLGGDVATRQRLVACAQASLEDGLGFEEAAAPFERWSGRFAVFATSTVNPLELRGFNRVSLYHRIPWLHATVDGPFLLVGPTFVPFRSACFECLETRILMNLRESASYQRYKQALVDGRVVGATAPLDTVLEAMLASLTAFEALNFLLTGASFTVGKVLAVYLPTMEFTFNEVLRVPGCPACSPTPERDERELYFDIRALLQGAH